MMCHPRHSNEETIRARVMRLIHDSPGLSGVIIAARLGVQYSTMTGILPKLGRRGLIVRHEVTDPNHFRYGEMGYFVVAPQDSPCP